MNAPQPAQTLAAASTATAAPAAVTPDNDFERLMQRHSAFSTRDLLVDDTLDKVLRLADVMASGRITCPKHLQGNVGDCAAVIGQAMRWGFDHNAVAQKTHVVNGVLGYESQLIVAALNSSALLTSRIDYAWADGWDGTGGKADNNPNHWCEVSARLQGETKPRVLRVSMAQVGSVRNSPNWISDARQQLAYLAAKRWGRLHAPDVLLGVYSPDELKFAADDLEAEAADPTPAPKPELQAYEAAAFAKNLPAWTKLVADGKKTAADLLAMLSTKATFSPAQQKQILALQPAAPAAPAAAPEPEPEGDDTDDFVKDMDSAEAEQ